MCSAPKQAPPAPAPMAPPTLDQLAPKSAADGTTGRKLKKNGYSAYKLDPIPAATSSNTQLGGIPKKTGV